MGSFYLNITFFHLHSLNLELCYKYILLISEEQCVVDGVLLNIRDGTVVRKKRNFSSSVLNKIIISVRHNGNRKLHISYRMIRVTLRGIANKYFCLQRVFESQCYFSFTADPDNSFTAFRSHSAHRKHSILGIPQGNYQPTMLVSFTHIFKE